MRSHRIPLYATAFAALAIAGCGSDSAQQNAPATPAPQSPTSADKPTPQSSSSAPRSAVQQPANSCAVGTWHADGFSVKADSTTSEGGLGTTMVIAPDGRADVDFTGMSPITDTYTRNDGTKSITRVQFGGKASGTVHLPPAGDSKSDWVSEPGVDWGGTTITFEFQGTKMDDNVPLPSVAGTFTAYATNVEPLLGKGEYSCTATTLTIDQHVNSEHDIWSFRRQP